jgi:hypothetical protein
LYQAAAVAASAPGCAFLFFFLVLLVNDSEYSKSAGTKPILSRGCIYLVSPGARCCCCCGSCGFVLLLLRALTPPCSCLDRIIPVVGVFRVCTVVEDNW